MQSFDHCICSWCGERRLHTPERREGCTGCWCDHPAAQKTHRVRLKIATIPKPAKDVDDLLRLLGDAAYERMIEDARPAVAWMIDNLESRGYDLITLEGKQDAADAMLGTFLTVPFIERNGYIRMMAERLEISEDELRDALNEAFERIGPPVRRLQDHLQEDANEMQTDANAEEEVREQKRSLLDVLDLDC